MASTLFVRGLAAALALLGLSAAHAATLARAITPPAFGDAVRIQLDNDGFPIYMPATRYRLRGSVLEIESEYVRDAFGPWRPDFALPPALEVGELAPGDYRISAKMLDLGTERRDVVLSGSFNVPAPSSPGLYTVPRTPLANGALQVVLATAAPVRADSVKVAVGAGVVRVDFAFDPAVPGYLQSTVAKVPALPPGRYAFEAWGTPTGGGEPSRYFSREIVIPREAAVVEFYHAGLDHYFLTASADDVAALDTGIHGDWKRTGQKFRAWPGANDVVGALPVCRFYSEGSRSHLFTIESGRCEELKALEKQGKSDAAARKGPYLGYQYEGIAFHAYPAREGECPAPLRTVTRFSRLEEGGTAYRFTSDALQSLATRLSWTDEGAAFCVPAG